MENEQSAIAILLFRVGPVLCCAPTNPIQTIISPPKLTHPPGSNAARPGIFYHANHIVSVSELRHRFGVAETARNQPGSLIISQQDETFIAYWVDEIIEVINTPSQGWSEFARHLPQGIFSKTLLLNEKIYLFANFSDFESLPDNNYLSQYIDKLGSGMSAAEIIADDGEDELKAQVSTETNDTAESGHVDAMAMAADMQQNTSQPDTANDPQDATKSAQTTTQHPIDADEPEDTATPPQAARPDGETEDEKTVSTDANEQQTTSSTAHTTKLTNSEAVPQAEQHDALDALAEINNDTTEISATKPASESITVPSLEAPPLEPGPVSAEPQQESKKSPFPWQNLAAAVILFLTIAGIGIYYSSSNKTFKPASKNSPAIMAQQLAVDKKNKAATIRANLQQAEKKYHAEIKPDSKGVTIELHPPTDEPAFKTGRQPSTKSPRIQKKLSTHTNKRQQKARSGTQEIIHIVVKGDTLWAIAKRYVNNPYRYSRLARLSKIKNPDQIYPGNRVRILRVEHNAK